MERWVQVMTNFGDMCWARMATTGGQEGVTNSLFFCEQEGLIVANTFTEQEQNLLVPP